MRKQRAKYLFGSQLVRLHQEHSVLKISLIIVKGMRNHAWTTRVNFKSKRLLFAKLRWLSGLLLLACFLSANGLEWNGWILYFLLGWCVLEKLVHCCFICSQRNCCLVCYSSKTCITRILWLFLVLWGRGGNFPILLNQIFEFRNR